MTKNNKILLIATVILLIIIVIDVYHTLNLPAQKEATGDNPPPPFQQSKDLSVTIDLRSGKERWTAGQAVRDLTLRKVHDSSRNPVHAVYSGDKKLGEIAALEIYKPTVSTDGMHAVIMTGIVCGAGCLDLGTYIADKEAGSLTQLETPRQDDDYTGGQTGDVVYEINSAEWIDDATLKITGFYVVPTSEGYRRISPKEVWVYGLINQTYSLQQTLPE